MDNCKRNPPGELRSRKTEEKRTMVSRCVLITGGAGFIGSNLARDLAAAGHRVIAIDDLSLGRTANLTSGVPLLVGDVASPETWRHPSLEAPVDAVVHLAGA